MKKRFLSCLIFLWIWTASGHEFWIQPNKFFYKRGETTSLRFLTGDNFDGENWGGNREKIRSLRLYFGEVTDKNLDDNIGSGIGDSLKLAMYDEGTVMVTLNTKNVYHEVDAPGFNAYLREYGLTAVLDQRAKNGDSAKNAKENFQRSVKTIFLVGSHATNVYKQRTNLPLDLVPSDNPYAVAKDGSFKLRVFFLGEKLKNARVRVWHRVNNKLSEQDYTTDDDGEVKFFLSATGEWMVSCVATAQDNNADDQWQTYWGSVTWGYY
jgi:uncharacterized GH25 family protein